MSHDTPNTDTERPSLSPSFSELAMPSMGACDFNDPREIIKNFHEYRDLLVLILKRSNSDEEAARVMRDEIGLKEKMTIGEVIKFREKLQFVSAINSRPQSKDSNWVINEFRQAM